MSRQNAAFGPSSLLVMSSMRQLAAYSPRAPLFAPGKSSFISSSGPGISLVFASSARGFMYGYTSTIPVRLP